MVFMGEEFYEKKVRCPLCENEYNTKKVLTRAVKTAQAESDFYATYYGPNPNHYVVNVCPGCSYAFLEKTVPKIDRRTRQKFLDEVAPRWRPRSYGEARSVHEALVAVKLAIFCAQYVEEPARTVGGLCLHAAWLYRELGDEAQERRFLEETIAFYSYAYERDSRIEDDGRLTYLLGELHRRLGNRKEAVFYFNQVAQDKKALPKYSRRAREQWQLLAEEQRMSG